LEVLGQVDPGFAEARTQYLADPAKLFDPTEILVDLHGLRRLASERVEFWVDQHGVEHPPPLVDILSEIVLVQERAHRIRQRAMATQGIDKKLVDQLVANVVQVIVEFVDPRDVSAALAKLRELQARCVPPRAAE
jgi:hypothetical protein